MNRSIFRKLLVSFMTSVILGLAALGLVISMLVQGYIENDKQEELLRKAKKVNLMIQDSGTVDEETVQLLVFLDQTFDTRIWVFDRNGTIVATSTQDEVSIGKSVGPSILERVLNGRTASDDMSFEGISEPTVSAAVPWGQENEVYGGIVLHAPAGGLTETVGNIREAILWATTVGILLSLLLVSYLSWSVSKPLQHIKRAASEIGMGDYKKRIRVDSADEIEELAGTINRMAEKLETIEQERRQFEQSRTDFLANVSHELGTPLTAMQGFLEALQDDLIPEEARHHYYGIMYQETLYMNRLVDDILDLTKLENKEVALSRHAVDVGALLHKMAFKFRQEAADRRLEVRIDPSGDGLRCYADQDRLEQILANLLKNAVKFTDVGSITLGAEEKGDAIALYVTDTGTGIAEADLGRIWERFFKADRGRSKKTKGTGLGLAIVKQLVELHEGSISVQSRLEHGSTFEVLIPKPKQPIPDGDAPNH